MAYQDMFTQDIYENEFDEQMHRQFPQTYKAIKRFYPEAYKLPETEIQKMSDVMYDSGDTAESITNGLKSYIDKNKPLWNANYTHNFPQTDTQKLFQSTRAESDIKHMQDFQQAQNRNQKRLNEYNNREFYLTPQQWLDVAYAAKEGMYSGMENQIDGMSGGTYNLLDDLSDNETKKRYDQLREDAYQSGCGQLYDLSQFFNRKLGESIPLAVISPALKFK